MWTVAMEEAKMWMVEMVVVRCTAKMRPAKVGRGLVVSVLGKTVGRGCRGREREMTW